MRVDPLDLYTQVFKKLLASAGRDLQVVMFHYHRLDALWLQFQCVVPLEITTCV